MSKREEVFNVRMRVQPSEAKMKKEVTALCSLMKQIVTTHTSTKSNVKAFRIVVVALEDEDDPFLCPHCRPNCPCSVHTVQ